MPSPEPSAPPVVRDGDVIRLPGLATAHSHAFQRGLRGRTQRLPAGAAGSFWSWRGLMYRFAERLDPESMYALARFAYAELARHGVTAVGEFHYVHHQPDGTPYGERTTMADAVIRAARDAGLRVTLLRVLYHRAGAGRAPEGAQRRFSDARLEDALADVEAL
ncbi:MAG TPA: amidohydrolase family protein, partial [Polyangiaceae bacterium LLY-WYZ-15_(1-7)]|nr:amidohydrolase family protein [Polyangiaceae bacterium LLY-WYZ-15_(1-7)]